MSVRNLRTLVAIAETGSFRDAALRLNLTQAAVSQQVRALEDVYGDDLFDRTTRPARLTAKAWALVDKARAVIAGYDDLARLTQDDAPLAGPLTIGVIPTASIRILPALVRRLVRFHPECQLRIESGLSDELVSRLALREIDAALVTQAGSLPDGLDGAPVETEPMVLARGLTPAAQAPPRLEDFAHAPFVRFRRSAGVGRVIDGYLTAKGIAPSDVIELDSIEAIVALVVTGFGMTIVPEADAERYGAGQVVTTPLDLTRTVLLVTRVGDTGRQQALVNLLSDPE